MKTILFIILATLLVSCGPFGLNPMGYEILHEDLDTAWRLVSSMEYQDDPEHYFKSPTEFFRDGGGDCEDFAAALVYLLGPEAELVEILSTAGIHYIVKYKDQYLEPHILYQFCYSNFMTILNIYTYDQAMRAATRYGIKNL